MDEREGCVIRGGGERERKRKRERERERERDVEGDKNVVEPVTELATHSLGICLVSSYLTVELTLERIAK